VFVAAKLCTKAGAYGEDNPNRPLLYRFRFVELYPVQFQTLALLSFLDEARC
jgi:hypothetical protein